MATQASLVVNGKPISVARGDVLLDAVMGAGIAIPHDCSTGQCETCRVRVYDGEIDAKVRSAAIPCWPVRRGSQAMR